MARVTAILPKLWPGNRCRVGWTVDSGDRSSTVDWGSTKVGAVARGTVVTGGAEWGDVLRAGTVAVSAGLPVVAEGDRFSRMGSDIRLPNGRGDRGGLRDQERL